MDILILLYYFIFACLLIVAFAFDLKHRLIPDFVSAGILGLAFLRLLVVFCGNSCGRSDLPQTWKVGLSTDLTAAFAVFLLFWGIWFFSKGRAMGFGDVKLAPAITLFLGYRVGILAILLSFWFGAITGVFLILWSRLRKVGLSPSGEGPVRLSLWESLTPAESRRFSLKSEIPFGPFLVLGAITALLWGKAILALYFGFLYNYY